MVNENGVTELANKVRRSIFLSGELEATLARLAEERGTTTNDLIYEILVQGVEALTTGSSTDERTE